MSFGDGIAMSIGSKNNATEYDINVEGNAIALPTTKQSITITAVPLSSGIPDYERIAKISYNNCGKLVIQDAIATIKNQVHISQNFFIGSKELELIAKVKIMGSIIPPVTAIIKDSTVVKHCVMDYLVMDSRKIISPSVNILQIIQEIIKNTEKVRFAITTNKTILTTTLKESKATISNGGYPKTKFMPSYATITNGIKTVFAPTINIVTNTAIIYDYRPPASTTGTTSSTGQGLNGFTIVLQKQSYFQQALSFSNVTISSAFGLPQGMLCENGILFGSPIISGDYAVTFKMNDKTSISGLLSVTNVPREL